MQQVNEKFWTSARNRENPFGLTANIPENSALFDIAYSLNKIVAPLMGSNWAGSTGVYVSGDVVVVGDITTYFIAKNIVVIRFRGITNIISIVNKNTIEIMSADDANYDRFSVVRYHSDNNNKVVSSPRTFFNGTIYWE